MAASVLKLLCPCCKLGDRGDEEERRKLLDRQRNDSSTSRHSGPATGLSAARDGCKISVSHANNDEQAVLNEIVQQTASEVIDVAALEAQTLEPREYVERARQYSSLLSHMKLSPGLTCAASPVVSLQPVNSVEATLCRPPMSCRSIEELDKAASDIHAAFADLKLQPVENLVVHFS